MLGDRLLGESVNLSPVLTAGWAGLIVNALNCLPVGGSHASLSSLALLSACSALHQSCDVNSKLAWFETQGCDQRRCRCPGGAK